MSNFQAFAVRGKLGPVVTLQAGVDFGGYYWTTTSRSAAKVAALRRDPSASVLSRKDDDSWRLRTGRGLVLDPSRAPEAMRDLPVYALAGSAVALIAVRFPEQLLGYVADGGATPKAWRLQNRVLIAIRHEDELVWTDDGVVTSRTDRFRNHVTTRRGTARPHAPRSIFDHERDESLLDIDGSCWVGLDSDTGPIVLPGQWRANTSTVGIRAAVLAATDTQLPGRSCITIDDSDSPRPSDKSGVIARGDAALLRIRAGIASIAVDVDSMNTWNGFRLTVAAA